MGKTKVENKSSFNTIDDSRVDVYDFSRRGIPFESYRTAEYRLYKGLEEDVMMPQLDAHLEKLFAGEVDDGNGDMLTGIIFTPAREALPDLDRQRTDHKDMIRRLAARRKADEEDFGRMLTNKQVELEKLEDEYKRVCIKIEENGEEL